MGITIIPKPRFVAPATAPVIADEVCIDQLFSSSSSFSKSHMMDANMNCYDQDENINKLMSNVFDCEKNDVFDTKKIILLNKYGMHTKADRLFCTTVKYARFDSRAIVILKNNGMEHLAYELFERTIGYMNHYDQGAVIRLFYSGFEALAVRPYEITVSFACDDVSLESSEGNHDFPIQSDRPALPFLF